MNFLVVTVTAFFAIYLDEHEDVVDADLDLFDQLDLEHEAQRVLRTNRRAELDRRLVAVSKAYPYFTVQCSRAWSA